MALDFEQPVADIEKRIDELTELNKDPDVDFDSEITELERKREPILRKIYADLTPWQIVQVARHPQRPLLHNYLEGMCEEFIELHGDRRAADDRALLGGFATVGNHKVMLLGMEKGRSVDDRVACNFGMANPDGYRKALRLMKLAEKYRIPILCLVDTPAAYPGLEAEARGQAEAIARNLTEMATLQVPIVVVITGEGGSGGALGIAVGDAVLMLQYAIYSVIPPEGCAAILWRDSKMAPEAAEALKITADSLLGMGIVEEVIPEPTGGAHRGKDETLRNVRDAVVRHLSRLKRYPTKRLVEKRFEKYAKIGKFDTRKYAIH